MSGDIDDKYLWSNTEETTKLSCEFRQAKSLLKWLRK